MRIEREYVTESTLEAFADAHGLVMAITERADARLPRYIAQFRNAEVGGDGMLRSAYGQGDTEEAAMVDYARNISLKKLIVEAYGPSRREIKVPRLIHRITS